MRTSRRRPVPVVNGLFVFTLVLLAYMDAIGFGMVWFRHQLSVTANANRDLEKQIREMQREVSEVSAEIAIELNPEELLRKNVRFGLNLVRPHERQVFRVTDDVERRLAGKNLEHRYYAVQAEHDGGNDPADAAPATSSR